MSTAAIARNAPCPCGSGKRFKDCHGAVGARPSEPISADSLLREAQFALAGGQPAAAHALLDRAIGLDPKRYDLLRERARIELTLGDERAATSCRAALELAPADAVAWNLLGEILNATDASGAEAAWREALRLDPGNPEALFHLGNRLRERGDNDAAIDYFQRALRAAPGHAGVLNNLGLALEAVGQRERAEACYREVLATQPQYADALANLANLLQAQRRYREAILFYERAVAIRRDFPASFWIARGAALNELNGFADAEESFRQAARLVPDHVPTQVDLGSVCIVQGKFDRAEAALARAVAVDPGNLYAATMLAYCRMNLCQWEGLEQSFAHLRTLIAEHGPRVQYDTPPLPLLAMPLGPEIELAAARAWAKHVAARVATVRLPEAAQARAAGERLRVGFVSSDFREHPVAYLLAECFERIDRSRIETFGYGLLRQGRDPLARRVGQSVEHFIDCSGDAVETIARRILEDRIDVLFDLNGYTTHAKSEIFVLKPAPVQINFLGYLGTLGADWYDYVLTDRFVVPPSQQAFFVERALYLPDCYCPSDTQRPVAAHAPPRAACGLPEAGFVFCCFNNCYKILPPVFDVWMRLLAAVPESVLWLSPANPIAGTNLRKEAALRGVDPDRVVFAQRQDLAEHLARHAHADLFLDTTPYNAGTTANDALFMGVPVLTCAGATMASRVAGSQLNAIGLSELVTTSLEDYEALALELARQPRLLQRYRDRLRANRHTHPLFDMARFTRALDDLLLAAWENRSALHH